MEATGKIKRYRRFAGWDYAKGTSLFITIATEPRRALFGKVRGDAVALSPLGEKVKEVLSLRISRQVQGSAMAKMLARIESAVDQGYVIISGFISKGEQAVRDMLCARGNARFIRILPSCIPNRRFRPESRYAVPFAEGRYLEIAQGNDEVEFGRRACLDINAEIIEIATAGEGLAIYWKADGPHVLAKHSLAIKSAGEDESHSSAIESAGSGVSNPAINAGVGNLAINAGSGLSDSASNVRGGHALQQCCLLGFDPGNDGQTGFGQKRRGQ